MARHARRREHRAARRLTLPLAVLGLGFVHLGTATTGLGLASAVAAPVPDGPGEQTDGAPPVGSARPNSAANPNGTVNPRSTAPGADLAGTTLDGESTTPCAATIQACVRLSTREVWITDGAGKVLRGPIRMNHGDDENPTPTGTFHVQRKDRYHVSQEQQGRKMPYAVFFDGEGRAFHQGDPDRQSVGCVRMAREDARFVFENLDIGDSVQIVK